jgi:hypothetical protein
MQRLGEIIEEYLSEKGILPEPEELADVTEEEFAFAGDAI